MSAFLPNSLLHCLSGLLAMVQSDVGLGQSSIKSLSDRLCRLFQGYSLQMQCAT